MNKNHSHPDLTHISGSLPQPGFFSISNQIRYGFLIIILLSLFITAGSLIYLSLQVHSRHLERIQLERSQVVAGEIDAYLNDVQRPLRYLAQVRGLATRPHQFQVYLLEGLNRQNGAYEMAAILGASGQVRAFLSSDEVALPENIADSVLFERTFQQQEDFVGPVEIDPTSGLPTVTFAVPLRNQADEVAGVLLARINLESLWSIVSQVEVGETGYAYLLDSRNFLVADKWSTPATFELKDISDRPFVKPLTSGTVAGLIPYEGLTGQTVLGAAAPIRSIRGKVIVELPTAEAFAPIRNMLWVMGLALVVTTAIAVGLSVFFTRQIVLPLQRLTRAAAMISAGDLDTQVEIAGRTEMGILTATFNEMTTRLRQSIRNLEHRTSALETSAKISRSLSTMLDPEQLISAVVEQLRSAFDYYYVHLYLFDDQGEKLVMAGGTGEAGRTMLAGGHSITAGKGLVGRAAETNSIVLAPDVSRARGWLPNPLLPETKAEVAVPIAIGEEVVGVLDVQHNVAGSLGQLEADLIQTFANQVAIALQNARLYQAAQRQANREAVINAIGQKIQRATTMESLLQTAVRELGLVLGAERTAIQLNRSAQMENGQKTTA